MDGYYILFIVCIYIYMSQVQLTMIKIWVTTLWGYFNQVVFAMHIMVTSLVRKLDLFCALTTRVQSFACACGQMAKGPRF